jgi:predicted CoA-substrate-specific enzyme activase
MTITAGIDLGSRAVKALLYDADRRVMVSARVVDATGDHRSDADNILNALLEAARLKPSRVAAVILTGYGRHTADLKGDIVTEITCHAAGARALFGGARTVIDIGGQDSKAVYLGADGKVADFAMNDRCAAGTGRFLEVVAGILRTDIGGMAGLAAASRSDLDISSTCVVFAESEVIGLLAKGVARADIAAGVHRAIARRVAGLTERRRFETPVVFTGGVAMNKAMVAALGRELKERLLVPRDPRLTGALGAALLAAQRLGKKTALASDRTPRARVERAPAASPAPPGTPCSGSLPEPPAAPREAAPVHRPSVPALKRFDRMVENAIAYARKAKASGRKIVGMFCEYTPRELILAAGAVPVCACGGSHEMALAGERELPVNLCPLIKSSYGFMLEKANPIFEMADLVVAETTCDGKKKMYELMGRTKTMHVLELTQKPDQEAAYVHWLSEIKLLKARLEKLTGTRITRPRLREAIRLMNEERRLRREIAAFGGRGLSGREILDAKSLVSGIPGDLAAYRAVIGQAAAASAPTRKPRILMTGVPMPHGAEKIIDIVEDAGAAVVAQENCTGLKPLVDDVALDGDPLEAIARKYFRLACSCMTPNQGRFDLLDELIGRFRPQGVIDLVWSACHTYSVEARAVRRHIEEVHKLPYLMVETDYSPSDSQQIRLRIESFLSLIENPAS